MRLAKTPAFGPMSLAFGTPALCRRRNRYETAASFVSSSTEAGGGAPVLKVGAWAHNPITWVGAGCGFVSAEPMPS
jgi:hypothetical protein